MTADLPVLTEAVIDQPSLEAPTTPNLVTVVVMGPEQAGAPHTPIANLNRIAIDETLKEKVNEPEVVQAVKPGGQVGRATIVEGTGATPGTGRR